MRNAGQVINVKILAGQTASEVVDLHNAVVGGIFIPTVSGTTLSFKGKLHADDALVALTKGNGTTNTALTTPMTSNILLTPVGDLEVALRGTRFLQLVSGTTEAAERTFRILLRE